MELRFFQTYDSNGVESEKVLQYWDDNALMWFDVELVRVHERDEEDALHAPPY